MSKIDEMIAKLCPNGVEYKTLGEIGSFERGRRFVKADAVEVGTPCIHYGELYTHYGISATEVKSYINPNLKTKLRYAEKNDVIIVAAGENNIDIGIAVAWLGNYKVAVHDACFIFRHQQDPKYISYFLRSETYHKQIKKYVSEGKICSISAEGISKAIIPVPPIKIQEEIVSILDDYTEKTSELISNLEKELIARKKQYEFYRDQLLSFGKVSPPLTLRYFFIRDIITSLKTGLNPRQNFKLNEEGSSLPYITGKDIYGNKINISAKTDLINKATVELINKRASIENDDLLFASTGTGTVGRMAIVTNYNKDWAISETLYSLKPKKEFILTKYLLFILNSNDSKNQYEPKISKGSVPHLKVADLLNVKIPVPPLAEQERIVAILDRFDTLVNDISQGIPAEIEARKKQYEFYRDKLLSFKKAE